MASAPGKHTLPTIGERHKAKSTERTTARARGYDHRWEQFRKANLRKNPICAYCQGQGRVTPATVLDHDLPHNGDPHLFWDNTFTPLCARHHSVDKQRAEARLSGPNLLAWVAAMKAGGG